MIGDLLQTWFVRKAAWSVLSQTRLAGCDYDGLSGCMNEGWGGSVFLVAVVVKIVVGCTWLFLFSPGCLPASVI